MTTLMKAVVSARYGSPDVLEIQEVPKPEPQAGEVLIRVRATTVSRTDCGMLRPHPWFVRIVAGFLRPKRTILGMRFMPFEDRLDTGLHGGTPWRRHP